MKVCYNYRDINKALLKNQYLLLLIRKLLNAVYGAKSFIKLTIIIASNIIEIIPNYK